MSRHAHNNKHHASNGVPGTAVAEPHHPGLRPVVAETKPSPDELRRRAYQIYLERLARGEEGSEISDWQQAEASLTRKR